MKDCLEINDTQRIARPEKGKIKSLFLIYADFESMLVPEDKGVLNEKLSKNISLAVMAIN